MATLRQKKFVRLLSENIRLSKKQKSLGEIARKAGYSRQMSKTPGRILNTKGIKELMRHANLTEGLLLNSLADDIKDNPGDRLRELDMGFKIFGSYAPEKQQIEDVNKTQALILMVGFIKRLAEKAGENRSN